MREFDKEFTEARVTITREDFAMVVAEVIHEMRTEAMLATPDDKTVEENKIPAMIELFGGVFGAEIMCKLFNDEEDED